MQTSILSLSFSVFILYIIIFFILGGGGWYLLRVSDNKIKKNYAMVNNFIYSLNIQNMTSTHFAIKQTELIL